jgi:hypothetical protein
MIYSCSVQWRPLLSFRGTIRWFILAAVNGLSLASSPALADCSETARSWRQTYFIREQRLTKLEYAASYHEDTFKIGLKLNANSSEEKFSNFVSLVNRLLVPDLTQSNNILEVIDQYTIALKACSTTGWQSDANFQQVLRALTLNSRLTSVASNSSIKFSCEHKSPDPRRAHQVSTTSP